MDYQTFEKEISREILNTERFRFFVLIIVFAVLFLFAFSVFLIYNQFLRDVFKQSYFFLWAGIIPLLIIIRSFLIRYRIRKWQRKGFQISKKWRYVNSFIEISIPSVGILIFAQGLQSAYALVTPVVFLYFIFIILSALELDVFLSVFTGAVAAVEYFAIALFLLHQPGNVTGVPLLDFPIPYLARSIMLFASGVLAGVVARIIRNYMISSYYRLNQRNHIEKLFGQQVSQHIVDELIKTRQEIVSHRRFVCIMFLDIRGFTPLTENMTPEEIVAYQNNVFSFMIERVHEHKGIINQFVGDGFMATFGAPISYGTDCQNAINTAMAIIEDMKQKIKKGVIPDTKIGIGIHAGEAVTGNVGTSIRKQYSITGSVVILASRLEQLNKKFDSQVIISKDVLDRINTEVIQTSHLGLVEIKGRREPMEIFQIV